MERNNNIPIRNIYYMLSYAYQTLNLSEYKHIGVEKFESAKDLYAEILSIGIPVLIRGGLIREYVSVEESSTVIKGKIDINSSIKTNALVDKKLVVKYDEFSEDILLNQIIKATLVFLSHSAKIKQKKRRLFYGFLPYFSGVSDIELNLQRWKNVQYNRQNIRYQFVIDVSRYLFEELLLDESSTSQFMKQVQDEQRLAALYEKFIFSFFKRETNYCVSRPQIQWKVDDEFTEALPIMQTDLVLQKGNKTLIVDTKFYSENMVSRFEGGALKQKSSNLYQIFTYLNNWNKKSNEIVGGMLLYARTTVLNQPNHTYNIKGNQIFVLSLDLNQDFNGIKKDLFAYALQFFK
ncbi:5-methylcytosine-specific restriction enzyme subunit McrC [Pullulanibacillus pueri]|uniref:5-methylcytosine-specific restriction system specificity protein McrC n=1 Tax=Pullulanibacillus pueri TaxID=1437324 RepID=A0A8J3ELR3_9BACL|nr:restriction endonuclease [Pullulanibacillus pueri]MBM7682206.1 5-methylcytosine-specific restriction enzyme subunit McrC [Pullulanibacillus pueri]GGH80446.1 5-methylcytosine-specific restriction system specificity protein McrC [Pullulanibacillus pueri]